MPKIKTKPKLIKAGNTSVLINGNPPLVDIRIVAEDLYKKLEVIYENAKIVSNE